MHVAVRPPARQTWMPREPSLMPGPASSRWGRPVRSHHRSFLEVVPQVNASRQVFGTTHRADLHSPQEPALRTQPAIRATGAPNAGRPGGRHGSGELDPAAGLRRQIEVG